MRSIGEIVKDEIRELTPVVIYFFIAFNILGLTRTLILRQYGITVSTFFNATIGALVVAKVVDVWAVLSDTFADMSDKLNSDFYK